MNNSDLFLNIKKLAFIISLLYMNVMIRWLGYFYGLEKYVLYLLLETNLDYRLIFYCVHSNELLMYLRKIKPSKTYLYLAASIFFLSLSADFQSTTSIGSCFICFGVWAIMFVNSNKSSFYWIIIIDGLVKMLQVAELSRY